MEQQLKAAACVQPSLRRPLPGKPVAHNYGLLGLYFGLLWGIVAHYFGLLGLYYGLLWGIVAYYFGLLGLYYGLLWGIVAYYFGLLGVPGILLT